MVRDWPVSLSLSSQCLFFFRMRRSISFASLLGENDIGATSEQRVSRLSDGG